MTFFRPIVATLIMTLASLPSAADTSFPWPHESSDLSPDPAIRFGSLPNGMGYLIRPSSEPPGRVSVRLVFQAGSLMETEEQRGLAHFLEHMAFNGTLNFPAGEMVEYFQRLGMAFGADTNASTGFDRTAYQLELPDGDPSLRSESLRLLRDYADGILFGPEEIEKERGIILAEKISRDSVDFRTFEAEIEFLLPDTRFASRMPIGVKEVIETAPRSEFVEFYEQWYHPERTFLVVTGDMDPAAWEAAIRETFATYGEDRPGGPVPPAHGPVSFDGVEARVHREPEAKAVRFELSTGVPLGDEPDSAERRVREGQLQILNGILSRRLERIARDEDSPVLSSYAYTTPFFEFVELAGLSATVQPARWEEAVRIVESELRRALEHGFAESEILEAESNFLKGVRQRVAGEETRPTPEWADEYAQLINADRVPVSPTLELELAEQAAAVSTPGTLLELAREVWNRSGRRLFLSGSVPADAGDAELLALYEASRAEPVAAPAVLGDLVFPYGADGAVAPAEQTVVADPGVTQARYPNGVRANWKRTEFEEDVIVVSVRVGGGELTLPSDRPGLARFAEGAFVEGGLGEISYDDLRTVTAGREVSTRLTVEGNAFELRGKTRPEDLELQMDILRAYLLDPGLRPEGQSVFRRSIAPTFRELRSTWQGVLQSRGWPFLYGRFGVQNFPTEEELRARSYEELREWLLPQMANGYLEISIVGDFEEEALRASLDRVFGTLPGQRPETPRHAPGPEGPRFPAGEEEDFPVESDIPQGIALVAFPSTGLAPVEQSRTLSLLASVLDDRLRLRIREETGQAYSYTAANRATDVPDFGIFFAVAILSPDKVAPLARQIQEIASSLTDSPVTEDERERALAPTLKQLEDMRRNNGYWIRVVGGSQNRPAQLEWSRTLLDGYRNISLDDLNRAAEEFIRPAEAAVVRIRSGD